MERRVIVIVGPTCSGKTLLSLNLGQKLRTEIISADSRQIYKYLDVGTAKPSKEELQKVKHHFIDSLEPNQIFNVSNFENEALKIIKQLHRAKKIPIVVGGSGLYIKAVVDGIFNEVDTDQEFRKELLSEKKKFGNKYLYKKLIEVDEVSADSMLPQNWKRVIRALEVYHITGIPIWKFHEEHKRETEFEFLQFGLNWEREILYKNINNRVNKMIEHELELEVKRLIDAGFSSDENSLNTVGYKEMIAYMNGEYDIDKAIELIKRNTRRYAKRQMTWFRKDNRINWMKVDAEYDLVEIADKIVKIVNRI